MSKESFESLLESLEEIVGKLEEGKLPLNESIDNFEKGVKLYQKCKVLLDSAEKKIKVLTDDLKEKDFER